MWNGAKLMSTSQSGSLDHLYHNHLGTEGFTVFVNTVRYLLCFSVLWYRRTNSVVRCNATDMFYTWARWLWSGKSLPQDHVRLHCKEQIIIARRLCVLKERSWLSLWTWWYPTGSFYESHVLIKTSQGEPYRAMYRYTQFRRKSLVKVNWSLKFPHFN